MEKHLYFLVAGGDSRQRHLTELLKEDGHRVETLALLDEEEFPRPRIRQADCVVLPLPPEDGGGMLNAPLSSRRVPMKKLTEQFRPGQLICAGGVSETLRQGAEKTGFRLVNYLARPELAEENAVPTAEGAIRIAMEELPCTIHGCSILVIGAGRCGMALAKRLAALHGVVTVSARNRRDMARIRSEGLTAADTETLSPSGFRLVVNTVPALVLDRGRLEGLDSDCLVIDLASMPGGVDWIAAEELGVKAISALGLPGKESPRTAARIIRDTIYQIAGECEE